MPALELSFDELTELDGVAGDGDLGVTVRSGARAIAVAVARLDDGASPAELLRVVGAAFARGNPSSFAALVGGGLLAGSRALADATEFAEDDVVSLMRAAAATIAERGRSAVGDRTVLDSLVPSIDALESAETQPLAAAIAAAARGVSQTETMEAKKGRARWLGDRGAGYADAGATAYLRFLEALRGSVVSTHNPSQSR